MKTIEPRKVFVAGVVALAMVGCAGPQRRTDAVPPQIAYNRPSSDVLPGRPAVRTTVTVEPIPADALRDPARMMTVKLWIERQIGTQARNIPEERYQRLVRPRIAHELTAAGLSAVDVGDILRGVDYHRSL